MCIFLRHCWVLPFPNPFCHLPASGSGFRDGTAEILSPSSRNAKRETDQVVPLWGHFYKRLKKKLSVGCSCKYFTRNWLCEGFSLLLEPDSSEIVLLVKIALGSHQHGLVSNSAETQGISESVFFFYGNV